MLAVSLPAGTASAQSGTAHTVQADTHAAPRAGALPAALSPAQQSALVAQKQSQASTTASSLHLGANEKLVVKDVEKDADGSVHTRYERTYLGLPVLGGDLVVAQDATGATTGVDRATGATIAVSSVTPAKSADSAKSYALTAARAQGAADPTAAAAPRKVIWAANGTPTLAWESVIGGFQDDGTPNQLHVITDATTGAKLFQYQGIETSVGNSEYSGQVNITTTKSGSTYNLTDGSRGGHSTYNLNHATSGKGTLFTDADDVWGDGNGATAQTAGVDAAFGAQETWDYYKNTFGRSGIRGDGVAAYSSTHYGNNYENAFWDDGCFCMTYGDGSGNTHPLTALDVAGHEMSHGVTSNTAGLNYTGESGGLNEATSDIMGTGVEFYANTAADPGDYLIGEKININGDGTPLRYMDKPSKDGGSKDYWSSSLGGLDVHYSSGPANHFFYLLSEGSGAKVIGGVSYNSPTSDGLSVPGIGRDNALKLWYKALTERFTSTTNYASARTQSLQAAADLWGAGSATYNTVANTWAAIGVGSRVSTPSGVTVTNPGARSTVVNTATSLQISASSTNGGALTYSATGLPTGLSIGASTGLISGTPTATGTYNVTVTAKDSTNATGTASFTWTVTASGGGGGGGQLLLNPGFESGATSWTQSSGVIDNSTGAPAHSGSYKAWLDGYGTTHTDTLSQSVTIPAGSTSATFSYYLYITTAETSTSTAYDKLTVTAGSTTLASYSNVNKGTGYVQRSVNLAPYIGQTVTLKFTGTEDSSLQTSFLIDDTAVNVS
ncbi:Zn-dependent metalloprotease [Streptomyces sp. DvalAA-14]|uniref:M4 family metallopeptidase n=1 Tax=unclassified Streptomyces TaxID=2593676 RepID=UPI00081B8B1F|nr:MULTISPECIES: M4 family metallopeptidase [unclassified Streptomyces]MYS20076.1 M4 family peptidase [Streptomyces sp. SID4948]SCD60326.1 Zn-dependent metalloprotease [Streptomyces sp. DvalAA-14]